MVLILKGVARLFAALPLRWALALGRAMGWVYGSVVRYHRADAFRALSLAFPDTSRQEIAGIVGAMYRHLGLNMAEFLRMLGGDGAELDELIAVEGEAHMRQALDRGKGALALVSHLGNWELLTIAMARRFQPSGGIFKEMRQGPLTDYLVRSREQHQVRVFPQRHAYRACLKALRSGTLIGFVLDQNMIWKEGVFVNFFGRPACTTPGLAHLAAQAGAPVVPISITRERGGRHLLRIEPPLEPPPNRDPAVIQAATQQYTAIIEAWIRARPEQWIWIHRRWRTTPDKVEQAKRLKPAVPVEQTEDP